MILNSPLVKKLKFILIRKNFVKSTSVKKFNYLGRFTSGLKRSAPEDWIQRKKFLKSGFDEISLLFFQITTSGPNEGYFIEETLLNRVPNLLLILSVIYLVLGISGSLMICQPPEDWIQRKSFSKFNENSIELNAENEKPMLLDSKNDSDDAYVHWKDALRMKEFYLLWVTRLSIVLITQVNMGLSYSA